ncbi:MAG TPA: hypothetical protein VF924_10240 [Stellaceae bacterium]
MSARPRGFIKDWRPRSEALALLNQAKAVLVEYAEQLPLTLRQIFYRLVGVYAYEKSEQAYKRLTELLNKARRAGLVDMSAIRDDGFTSDQPYFFESVDDFLDAVGSWAGRLWFDRQRGQERRLVVWCEAAGMVPQLARIARPFGIEVCSSGGFDSLTDKHRIGQLWADSAVTVLHIGDHDPSSVHVFSSLAEDIEEFAAAYGGDVEFVRVAVTPEQAALYNLPSAPPKPTDNRRFEGNETWQAEALDPRTLAEILTAAIEKRFDRALYEAVLVRGCGMSDIGSAIAGAYVAVLEGEDRALNDRFSAAVVSAVRRRYPDDLNES